MTQSWSLICHILTLCAGRVGDSLDMMGGNFDRPIGAVDARHDHHSAVRGSGSNFGHSTEVFSSGDPNYIAFDYRSGDLVEILGRLLA